MTIVLAIAGGLLGLAGLLTIVRLLRGPTVHDRLVALEALVVTVVSGISVQAGLSGEGLNITLLAVVALVGFLSTVAVLRLILDEEQS